MIDKQMQQALNDQINAEMASAYLYLGMSAHFMDINLKGFAHWMRVQAKEEMGHAMKIYDFVIERNGSVSLAPIAAPKGKWASPLKVMEATLAHEEKVTALINALVALAKSKKDYATEVFLQWFVSEQVEEEANANEIVQQVKMIGNQSGPLFMLDAVLGKRE
jgi:ferritin